MAVTGNRRAVVSVQSRECSPELLERLSGSTLFPERPVGAAIVAVVCRGGGSLLYLTAPRMIDADRQVDYFLGLLPQEPVDGRDPRRDRVVIGSLDDSSPRWLSDKLLDPTNPAATRLRERVADFVATARQAGDEVALSYFEPSGNLQDYAATLGVPGDQADAGYIPLGTKSAGRDMFRALDIEVPVGTPECHDVDTLAEAVADLVLAGRRRLVLKLSSTAYGAGMGNATVDLTDVTGTERAEVVAEVAKRLPGSRLVDGRLGWAEFAGLIPHAGIVAEEFVGADELRSPSFQGRVTPTGAVECVSTHDQVLGGAGLTYVGSSFPADAAYRATVVEYGLRVGRYLVAQGVTTGDYGVDFIAARRGDTFRVLGCELNLRATGTKHGFVMASQLLDTVPDADGRLFTDTPDGRAERVYQASDSITDPSLVGLAPARLIDAVERSPLRYDHTRRTGTVLHMLSALPAYGKFGAVCIGRDAAEAAELMRATRALALDVAAHDA
ncbi:peptide ligase PGM1-related protein [Micromonospora humida]|uniref:peptide ligase PGM1-related protein n=1 Tax=Micromonospora humida TaxID=2809018 RepID=UPI00344ACBA8